MNDKKNFFDYLDMNLSQYINQLEECSELLRVKSKVDTDLEIAEIIDRQCKSVGGGKAILFENNGTVFPLLGNMMGSMNRLHSALRVNDLSEIEKRIDDLFLDITSPKKSLFEKLAMLPLLKEVAGFMPKHSNKKGSCQEFEIAPDLSLLPVLKCAPYDGGKFITLPLVHTIDPDSGSQNVGMYRMQLFENEVDTALQGDFKSSHTNKYAAVLKSPCALSEPHFETIANDFDTALQGDFKSSHTNKYAAVLKSPCALSEPHFETIANDFDTALQENFKTSHTNKYAAVLKSPCALSEPHFETIANDIDTSLQGDFKSSHTNKYAAVLKSPCALSEPHFETIANDFDTALQENLKSSHTNQKINTTGMHWHKHKTGAAHFDKYKEKGEKMPVVVCLGGDPLYTYCATAPLPEGIDEYILAGFLRKKAVKLVKCSTCDIEVPEDVDFVIEGYVDPAEEFAIEGDFGDHTGFYSLKDLYPKFHVTKITHRKNAVYPATIVGVPPMEDFYFALASERIFLKPIQMVIAPEVVDIWMPMEGVAHNIVVVTIDKRYQGQAFKVASALWGAGQMSFNKFCIVVDNEKPHLSPLEKVIEGLKSVDFKEDCTIVKGVLDVLDHATSKNGYGGKMCIDLTNHTNKRSNFSYKVVHNVKDAIDCDVALVVDQNIPLDSNMSIITWLVAANCDPSRDIQFDDNKVVIDGRAKVSQLDRHPNIVCSNIETIEKVDSRWGEYNLGDFIESPSRKLLPLVISQGAEITKH